MKPPLFQIWIPGQMPSGKNRTKIKFERREDGSWKTRRVPDRRESKRTGRKEPTPFERWAPAPTQALYWQRPPRPYTGMVRLEVAYWWSDDYTRDEDGRSGAIGNVLEQCFWIADDKQLRYVWSYHGLVTKSQAGLFIVGFAVPATTVFSSAHDDAEFRRSDRVQFRRALAMYGQKRPIVAP